MATDDEARLRVGAALRAQPEKKHRFRGRKKKTYPLLPSGHPIHFRRSQKLAWGLLAGVLGVGFIAGLYFLGLQQDWHNVFPFLPVHTSAKVWWDNGMNFITSPNWRNGIWRHGVRDKAEPEVWAIVGGILLGASLSRHVIKLPLLILGGMLMFAAVIAGALLITWFINFGPGKHLSNAHNWQDFVLGFIIGHAIHYLWMPMANSIRYQLVSFTLHRTTDVPVWVRLPIAPPGWRDMWSLLRAEGVGPVSLKKKEDKYKQSRYVVPLVVLVFLLIAVVGILAKYPIAHGVHIPVLNP